MANKDFFEQLARICQEYLADNKPSPSSATHAFLAQNVQESPIALFYYCIARNPSALQEDPLYLLIIAKLNTPYEVADKTAFFNEMINALKSIRHPLIFLNDIKILIQKLFPDLKNTIPHLYIAICKENFLTKPQNLTQYLYQSTDQEITNHNFIALNSYFDHNQSRANTFDLNPYEITLHPVTRYVKQLRFIEGRINTDEAYYLFSSYHIANMAHYLIEITHTVDLEDPYHNNIVPDHYKNHAFSLEIPDDYQKHIANSLGESLLIFLINKDLPTQLSEQMIEKFIKWNRNLEYLLKTFLLNFEKIVLDNPLSKAILTDKLISVLLSASRGQIARLQKTILYQSVITHDDLVAEQKKAEDIYRLSLQDRSSRTPINIFILRINALSNQYLDGFKGLLNAYKRGNTHNLDCARFMQTITQNTQGQESTVLIKVMLKIIDYRLEAFTREKHDKDFYKNYLEGLLLNDITLDLTCFLSEQPAFIVQLNNSLEEIAAKDYKTLERAIALQTSLDFFLELFDLKITQLDSHAQTIYSELFKIIPADTRKKLTLSYLLQTTSTSNNNNSINNSNASSASASNTLQYFT
jgi:hypothetical protein